MNVLGSLHKLLCVITTEIAHLFLANIKQQSSVGHIRRLQKVAEALMEK